MHGTELLVLFFLTASFLWISSGIFIYSSTRSRAIGVTVFVYAPCAMIAGWLLRSAFPSDLNQHWLDETPHWSAVVLQFILDSR